MHLSVLTKFCPQHFGLLTQYFSQVYASALNYCQCVFLQEEVQKRIWSLGTHYHICIAYPCKIHKPIKYINKQSLGRKGVGMAFPLKKALIMMSIGEDLWTVW